MKLFDETFNNWWSPVTVLPLSGLKYREWREADGLLEVAAGLHSLLIERRTMSKIDSSNAAPYPMRIAILLANNDQSPFSSLFPSDGDKVAAQLKAVRPRLECRVWSAVDNEFPELEDADGFIITGSPASVHDPLPWIKRLAADIPRFVGARKPLVGLCFGHQLIAHALGGMVERSQSGWRFGAVVTCYPTTRVWMTPQQRDVRLFASHAEQVTRLPRGATVLGSAAHCPNASYEIGRAVMTTQYHPEFSQAFMRALALEYEGELPGDVLKAAESELDQPSDGNVFFEWIANFMEHGHKPGSD